MSMLTINLLPWREQYRQQNRKNLIRKSILLLLSCYLILHGMSRQIHYQVEKNQNQFIQLQISSEELGSKLRKTKKIDERIRTQFKSLKAKLLNQGVQDLPLKLLILISQALPDQAYLERIEQSGYEAFLIGRVRSTGVFRQIIYRLNQSRLIKQALPVSLEKTKEQGVRYFSKEERFRIRCLLNIQVSHNG